MKIVPHEDNPLYSSYCVCTEWLKPGCVISVSDQGSLIKIWVCIESHELIIMSGSDQSDDEVCLALMVETYFLKIF